MAKLVDSETQVCSSRKAERGVEVAVRGDYHTNLMRSCRLLAAELNQIGIDDRIEQVKIYTVVQVSISWTL